ATNTWYHVAYTYTFNGTTGTQVLYLNGVEVAEATVTQSVSYDNHPLLFGADIENGTVRNWFPGQVADFSLWNVARTQAQIMVDMNRRLQGTETGLAGYWPLDTVSGTTIPDLSPNGNNGTLGSGSFFQPAWATVSGTPTPPVGNALSFNGTSDLVS